MQLNNYKQFILKEGYSKIIITFGVSFLLLFLGFSFFAKIGFIATLLLLWIYRNDLSLEHNPKNLSDTIYTPIDGRISAIDKVDENYTVYIDVGLFDNHILRSPINGNMEILSLCNGLNLSSWTYKSKFLNNRAKLLFIDESNIKISLTAITGIFGTDIILYNNIDKVSTRDVIGIFVQGTIVLELPKDYELKVKIGEKVSSGISVIAGKIESIIEE